LIDKDLLSNDIDIPSSSIGSLRKSLALEESDPRYDGKVVSRKELNDESEDSFDDDNYKNESDNGLNNE